MSIRPQEDYHDELEEAEETEHGAEEARDEVQQYMKYEVEEQCERVEGEKDFRQRGKRRCRG